MAYCARWFFNSLIAFIFFYPLSSSSIAPTTKLSMKLRLELISALHMGTCRRFQARCQASQRRIRAERMCSYPIKLLPKVNQIFRKHLFRACVRKHNKHADVLATLALKIDVLEEAVDVKVIDKTLQATGTYLIPSVPFDEQDWRDPIIQNLNQPYILLWLQTMRRSLLSYMPTLLSR